MTVADRQFLREWVGEASRLGLSWYERIAFILVVAFLLTAGKRVLAVLPKPTDPGPDPSRDDAQKAPTDAQWGANDPETNPP